jgi:hypothetical protein
MSTLFPLAAPTSGEDFCNKIIIRQETEEKNLKNKPLRSS